MVLEARCNIQNSHSDTRVGDEANGLWLRMPKAQCHDDDQKPKLTAEYQLQHSSTHLILRFSMKLTFLLDWTDTPISRVGIKDKGPNELER